MYQFPLQDMNGARTGVLAGYMGDSGEDIIFTGRARVVAPADGVLIYSEYGHTPWREAPDTPHSVLLRLDDAIEWAGWTLPLLYFTHLRSLMYDVPDGGNPLRVKAGAILGEAGLGNRIPHLHFGMLTNRAQRRGEYLPQWEVQRWLRSILAAPAQAKIWLHADGTTIDTAAIFGFRWPQNTHHVYIVADGKYIMYHGDPVTAKRLTFHQAGRRRVECVAYDSRNKEIGRDDLILNVT